MEGLSRTEVLCAHNQGRLKFHDQVGVRKLEWMTMEDERVCPVCGPLDGRVFDTNHFPQQPAHPNCRCTSVVSWPLVICGGELGAKAATEPATYIIPPQIPEEQTKDKAVFEGGQLADLNTLSVKQLQTLASRTSSQSPGPKATSSICLTQLSRAWTTPLSLEPHSMPSSRNIRSACSAPRTT
jgi:hypothetical protein